jgi:hypothetical protein
MGVDYWSLVEPVGLPLNQSWENGPDEFLRMFRAIRREIGHLYAAHWCQSEVCNGGFHQFFSNSTGLLAPEALEAFQAIGAADWAEILAEAMQHFGTPSGAARRVLALSPARSQREWDPFSRLDKRFYEWADNWGDTADAYAEQVLTKRTRLTGFELETVNTYEEDIRADRGPPTATRRERLPFRSERWTGIQEHAHHLLLLDHCSTNPAP